MPEVIVEEAEINLAPPDEMDYIELNGEDINLDENIEVVLEEDEANEIGAMLERFDIPFGENLVTFLDSVERARLSGDLLDSFEIDERSREEWEQTYKDGLELLGLKVEDRTCPWDGAFGAYHPLLTEAVVKFQSEAIVETFPAQGPVKTKILGDITKDRELSAFRVREDMNHLLTDEMPEYRSEHEKMLWSLPLAGSAFKKIWDNQTTDRPSSQFIPAEDFVVPYGATDLWSADRYTHRMRKTPNEILRLQLNGFYDKDVDLHEPAARTEFSDIEEAKNEFTGLDSSEDTRYTLLEMHCNLDLTGFEHVSEDGYATGLELPYIVTIERDSGEILSIYRNWVEGDINHEKRIHFSHYTYIPGFGFYGFGLIHLIGGFAKGATSVMRQLVDAGTLSNLPGGFKTRGFRIVGGDTPIAPGEWRDTDVATGTLKENIMPLPYKEPSIVLFELLKGIVEEGRRFAAVSDVNIADMQPNAPVGSTLAVLERTLKTMTAIHARIHAAMKHEFQLIKDIVASMAPTDYEYDAFGETNQKARQSDYAVVEIIPVSDPNASTMSQRIVMYQAALQLMQMNPGIYDEPLLHRSMLETLGMKDANKLVPDKTDIAPADPVTENMNLLNGAPVKAIQTQNHQAHITVHMAITQDPQIQEILQQQGPAAQAKYASAMAHLNEHLGFLYREKIEEQIGQKLPPADKQLPEEIEYQLAGMMAGAAQNVLKDSQTQAAQQEQQQKEADPLSIIQRGELEIKQAAQALAEKKQVDDNNIDKAELLTKAAQAEWNSEREQAELEIKVLEVANGEKADLRRDRLERDKKISDVDVEEYKGEMGERQSRRQFQSASRAASAAKRADKAKVRKDDKGT